MILPKYFIEFFSKEKDKEYFIDIFNKYDLLKRDHILFPKEEEIFRAFNFFDIKDLKVVILGQDPYYINGYANGLAFAVNKECVIPKSLQNIFKEIRNEYYYIHTDRTLVSWAKQGVLLLNTSLCVIENEPNSCSNMGWNIMVKNFIDYCNKNTKNIVYLLWGNNAKSFIPYISKDNYILSSGHPSPLSAKYFFNNNHFVKCNEYLIKHNKEPIVW